MKEQINDEAGFSLSRTNLSQQVADHLEEVILSSPSSMVSEKLPSEQQLAKEYAVSRPVIREALKLLQERGLVTLRNGLGAFITKPATSTVFSAVSRIMQMNHISDKDLTQMRGLIEVSAAKLAAQNATEKDLGNLRENMRRFSDKSLSLKERVSLDSQFHLIVAHASGNALLEMFNEVLISMLADYMGKGVLIAGGVDDAIARHQKIAEALYAHDVDASVKAMEEHIAYSEQNVERFAAQSKKGGTGKRTRKEE
ncbi:MAG: FCD domain-containing protein [Sphaerochaetaceae bacterium]|jgi:DNA-binding FadR family transcriptional regulator